MGASYIEQHCYSCKEGESGSTCKKWKIKLSMKDVADGAHIERLLWGENVSCPVTTLPVRVARPKMPAEQRTRGAGAGTRGVADVGFTFRHQQMGRLNSLFAIAATSVQKSSMSQVRRPRDVPKSSMSQVRRPRDVPKSSMSQVRRPRDVPKSSMSRVRRPRDVPKSSTPQVRRPRDVVAAAPPPTSKRQRRGAAPPRGGSGCRYVDDEAGFDGRRRMVDADDADDAAGNAGNADDADQNGDLVGFIAESDDDGGGTRGNDAAFYAQVGRIMDQRRRRRDG
jgi:hypothetical protein